MKSINESGTFKEAIAKSSPELQKLAAAVRKLVEDVHPGVFEVPWPRLRVVGYGIGPKKSTEHFCYIGIYSTHVNLGFNHGPNLEDPHKLLEGAGKSFRHVKIEKLSDLKRPGLRQLLRSAASERKRAHRKG